MKMNKVKLSDIADINSTTFCVNDFDEILYLDTSSVTKGVFGDFIHLSKNDTIPSRAKRAVRNKTIVYSTVRPNLQHVGIFDNPKENVVVSTGFATIDVKDSLADPKFLYYYLTQNKFTNYLHTIATNNVSSYPSINPSDLEKLDLKIPNDIKTQSAIVRVLSSLDDKIELNNKINKELENLARTIYEYWFVQNADESWEKKKIGEIAETSSGGTPLSSNREYYEGGNIAWVNSSELNWGYILDTRNFITEKGLKNSSAKLFPANSILIALYGATAGKVSLLTIPATTNQAICAIMPFSQLHTYYLKLYLSDLYKYFVSVSSGSARDNLSQELVKNLNITLPPKDILEKFDNIVKPLIRKIIINLQENIRLAQLRDFLLPLLMNGQVTVGKVQDEPIIIPFKIFADDDDDTKYQIWKEKNGIAARGDINERTLRNMYEAIDENDR